MARDKSRPDRPLEDGERLSEAEDRILSAAFVAHSQKGYLPATAKRPKPLSAELDEIANEHPELKRLLAIKLWRTALLGRGKNALAAAKILLDRIDGPLEPTRTAEMHQSVEVVVQEIQRPAPVLDVTAAPALPTDEQHALDLRRAKSTLRHEVRPMPQPSDILEGLQEEFERGRGT